MIVYIYHTYVAKLRKAFRQTTTVYHVHVISFQLCVHLGRKLIRFTNIAIRFSIRSICIRGKTEIVTASKAWAITWMVTYCISRLITHDGHLHCTNTCMILQAKQKRCNRGLPWFTLPPRNTSVSSKDVTTTALHNRHSRTLAIAHSMKVRSIPSVTWCTIEKHRHLSLPSAFQQPHVQMEHIPFPMALSIHSDYKHNPSNFPRL